MTVRLVMAASAGAAFASALVVLRGLSYWTESFPSRLEALEESVARHSGGEIDLHRKSGRQQAEAVAVQEDEARSPVPAENSLSLLRAFELVETRILEFESRVARLRALFESSSPVDAARDVPASEVRRVLARAVASGGGRDSRASILADRIRGWSVEDLDAFLDSQFALPDGDEERDEFRQYAMRRFRATQASLTAAHCRRSFEIGRRVDELEARGDFEPSPARPPQDEISAHILRDGVGRFVILRRGDHPDLYDESVNEEAAEAFVRDLLGAAESGWIRVSEP